MSRYTCGVEESAVVCCPVLRAVDVFVEDLVALDDLVLADVAESWGVVDLAISDGASEAEVGEVLLLGASLLVELAVFELVVAVVSLSLALPAHPARADARVVNVNVAAMTGFIVAGSQMARGFHDCGFRPKSNGVP